MKKIIVLLLTVVLGGCFMLAGCGGNGAGKKEKSLWDFKALSQIEPTVEDAGYTYAGSDNIKGIFFEGVEYNGAKTKIFAFIGVPKTEKPANGYPAMVLVHGGLGQAFGDWVKLWTDRGYVAIALSIDANITDSQNKPSKNAQGGPNISITPADMHNTKNSWEYISVANIILCNNILRSMEEVDASNIGITGISWGSFLMCAAVGVDTRFKFGIPVYGAGYNHEDVSSELASIFQMDDESYEIYTQYFDPSVYMSRANIPMLWIAGANDASFSLACNQKSADLNQNTNAFSWRAKLTHGQQPGDGSGLPEIFLFADSITKGKDELLRVSEGTVEDGSVHVQTLNDVKIESAYLYWSSYPLEYWHDAGNVWEREDVSVEENSLTVSVPDTAVFAFIEIADENGNIVSSRLFTF